MNLFIKTTTLSLALAGALSVSAAQQNLLYIVGDATPSGWDLDSAQALVSTEENPSLFSATLYLKGGETNTFKFMENHEWGGTEYGISEAGEVNGKFTLVSGTLDEGYSKLHVAESGNYLISVNTETMTGEISRSSYQDTEIKYGSLLMIGGATPGGWSVDNATIMYQESGAPYEYKADVVLTADGNSFKIGTAMRGAKSFDSRFYMFRDADNAGLISSDSTDDRQWSVGTSGKYSVTVNTVAGTIAIEDENGNSAAIELLDLTHDEVSYYTLHGVKVANPTEGIYIELRGNKARKVIL